MAAAARRKAAWEADGVFRGVSGSRNDVEASGSGQGADDDDAQKSRTGENVIDISDDEVDA